MDQQSSLEHLTAAIDAMTQQLRETSQQIDAAKRDLSQSRWLQPLRAMSRKLANMTLKTLPRVTRQMQRTWEQAAREQLTDQYSRWAAELNAVQDNLHDQV